MNRPVAHLVPSVQAVAVCAKQAQIADVGRPITKTITPNTCPSFVTEFSGRVDVVNIKDAVIVFATHDASAAKFHDQRKFAPPIGRVLVLFEPMLVPVVLAALLRAKAMLTQASAPLARFLPFPSRGKITGPPAILPCSIFEAIKVGFKRLFAVAAGDCNSAFFHVINIFDWCAKVNFDIACKRIEDAQRQSDLFIGAAA